MSEGIASMFSLGGKVAIVAGASRGIGEEIARTYSAAGARTVICSRSRERIDEAANRIRERGGEVLAVAANISAREDRQRLVEAAMDWAGRIDILVNNAATNTSYGPLDRITESAWDKAFETNLKGPLFLSQLVFNAWMKEHGGVILNISSVGGFKCTRGISAYNITKAAVMHLTRCMAAEWGRYGIRVNSLAPGLIRTEFSRVLWDGPEGAKAVESHPISRIGEVEDLAGAALLLASGAASFMTGHTLVVDGGQLLRS